MSTAVYYSGCLDVHPPLSREHAAIVEDVINLRESERAKPVFAAIRASDQPDLPYYGGQFFVSEDGATLEADDDEQRFGLRLWLVHLLKHFFTPNGYTLNGEVQWYCPDDIDDLGMIYVKDNQLEEVFTVIFDPGPSWQPNHFADEGIKKAIHELLESEDNTGCSDDLTVVSYEAVNQLRDLVAKTA